jgi:hypothetical protein
MAWASYWQGRAGVQYSAICFSIIKQLGDKEINPPLGGELF